MWITLKTGKTTREVSEEEIENLPQSIRNGSLGLNDLNLLDAVIHHVLNSCMSEHKGGGAKQEKQVGFKSTEIKEK